MLWGGGKKPKLFEVFAPNHDVKKAFNFNYSPQSSVFPPPKKKTISKTKSSKPVSIPKSLLNHLYINIRRSQSNLRVCQKTKKPRLPKNNLSLKTETKESMFFQSQNVAPHPTPPKKKKKSQKKTIYYNVNKKKSPFLKKKKNYKK